MGLDDHREVCLAVCRTPRASDDRDLAEQQDDLGDAIRHASQVSEKEIDYPAVRDIHRAGASVVSQPSPAPPMVSLLGSFPQEWRKLVSVVPWPETLSYGEAVIRRRSSRNFVNRPLSEACLTALLDGICGGGYGKTAEGTFGPHPTIAVGFLVGNAEGYDPGFYLLDTASRSQAVVRQGFFLDQMAHICLDQMWTAHAALHVVFLSNLEVVDRTGVRGATAMP